MIHELGSILSSKSKGAQKSSRKGKALKSRGDGTRKIFSKEQTASGKVSFLWVKSSVY